MRTFSAPQLQVPEADIETVTGLSRDQAHGIFYYEARIKHGQSSRQNV